MKKIKNPNFDERSRKKISDYQLRKFSKHAKKRFKERFDYCLSDEQLVEIEVLIQSGKGTLVNWTQGEPGIYLVNWMDFSFHAVYEYKTKKIITFLTTTMTFMSPLND